MVTFRFPRRHVPPFPAPRELHRLGPNRRMCAAVQTVSQADATVGECGPFLVCSNAVAQGRLSDLR